MSNPKPLHLEDGSAVVGPYAPEPVFIDNLDETVTALVGDPGSDVATALNATYARGLNVTNLGGLKRWAAARGKAR